MTLFGEGVQRRTIQLPGADSRWEYSPVLDGKAILLVAPDCPEGIVRQALARATRRVPVQTRDNVIGRGEHSSAVVKKGNVAYKQFRNIRAGSLANFSINVALAAALQQTPESERTWRGNMITGVDMHAAVMPDPQGFFHTRVTPIFAMEYLPGVSMEDYPSIKTLGSSWRSENGPPVICAKALHANGFDLRNIALDPHRDNFIYNAEKSTITKIDSMAHPSSLLNMEEGILQTIQ